MYKNKIDTWPNWAVKSFDLSISSLMFMQYIYVSYLTFQMKHKIFWAENSRFPDEGKCLQEYVFFYAVIRQIYKNPQNSAGAVSVHTLPAL
jgi:hypothetical protein